MSIKYRSEMIVETIKLRIKIEKAENRFSILLINHNISSQLTQVVSCQVLTKTVRAGMESMTLIKERQAI